MGLMKSIDYVIKENSVCGIKERPIVNLCIGHSTKDKKGGPPLITPNCISEREIDAEADRLIHAVNDARKRAKKAFRRAWGKG